MSILQNYSASHIIIFVWGFGLYVASEQAILSFMIMFVMLIIILNGRSSDSQAR